MKAAFCFFILFLPSSHSEPDTHIHVYIPPQSGEATNAVWGLFNERFGGGNDYNQGTDGYLPSGIWSKTGAGNDYNQGTDGVLPSGNSVNWSKTGAGNDYNQGTDGILPSGNSGNWSKTGAGHALSTDDRKDKLSGIVDASKILDPNNKWECGISPLSNMEPDSDYLDDGDLIGGDEINGGRLAEPNVFPWILQMCYDIRNGSYSCFCAANLITSLHALTTFHCVDNRAYGDKCAERDFSDGTDFVIPGRNEVTPNGRTDINIYNITVKGTLVPEYPGLRCENRWDIGHRWERHDFAMLVLKERVVFSVKIRPICLPLPGAKHWGQRVVAAGWGRPYTDNKKNDWTRWMSHLLKRVDLTVSNTKFNHSKMFGTKVEFKNGEYQDPCSGDSGGPLMYETPSSKRWVIIGTVNGAGYDCRNGQVRKFEETDEGIWNMVSSWTDWIEEEVKRKA